MARQESFEDLFTTVPELQLEPGLGSGYTSLAMLLQAHGYPYSPRAIFEKLHGHLDNDRESENPSPTPSFRHLATIAHDLTNPDDHNVDLWTDRQYAALNDLRRKNGKRELTAFDILGIYLSSEGPCLIRTVGSHQSNGYNMVVVGLDKSRGAYLINGPKSGKTLPFAQQWLQDEWSPSQPVYPGKTHYPMLAIRRKRIR